MCFVVGGRVYEEEKVFILAEPTAATWRENRTYRSVRAGAEWSPVPRQATSDPSPSALALLSIPSGLCSAGFQVTTAFAIVRCPTRARRSLPPRADKTTARHFSAHSSCRRTWRRGGGGGRIDVGDKSKEQRGGAGFRDYGAMVRAPAEASTAPGPSRPYSIER